MALAHFFDKTALAAASALKGFNLEEFQSKLSAQNIGITFDDSTVQSAEGKVSLSLAANLLARLYPTVTMIPLGECAQAFCGSVETTLKRINPRIDVCGWSPARTETHLPITMCIAVGSTRTPFQAPTVYVGSDRWVLRCSSERPVASGSSTIPFAAAAAACIGVANVFRHVFSSQLSNAGPDTDITMSVLDLNPLASSPLNPETEHADIGVLYLVGAGAIGNGFIWSLSHMPGLAGEIHVIDDELVDVSNLQRYVLTTTGDEGVAKVEVAKRFPRLATAVSIVDHKMTWGGFLSKRAAPWNFETIAVALDSAADRIAVQAALPRRLLNAWTQPGDLGISRHGFLDGRACLACLYLPTGRLKNEDQIVAEAIGLGGQELAIRQLLYTGAPVGVAIIEKIATALQVPVEPLLRFADRPLREFYSNAICGGLVLRLQCERPPAVLGDAPAVRERAAGTEVPLAFQSALPGILMAAEAVGEALGIQRIEETKSVINLLRPLGQQLNMSVAKHPSGRCLCQDADLIALFRRQHVTLGGA
jgi:molybdopterin/thiamine biosynthesis adenylyltransferase